MSRRSAGGQQEALHRPGQQGPAPGGGAGLNPDPPDLDGWRQDSSLRVKGRSYSSDHKSQNAPLLLSHAPGGRSRRSRWGSSGAQVTHASSRPVGQRFHQEPFSKSNNSKSSPPTSWNLEPTAQLLHRPLGQAQRADLEDQGPKVSRGASGGLSPRDEEEEGHSSQRGST